MEITKFVLVCCLIVVVVSKNNSKSLEYCIRSQKPQPNYYWRKYEGVIPHDAIPGGHTASGSITYIGQVLIVDPTRHKNAILPGTIEIGQPEVVAPYHGAYKSKKYAAILCSDTPSALKWRTVGGDDFPLIHDYLVVGGYEISQAAYIGRASYSNHLIIGKVFTQTQGLKAFLKIVPPDSNEIPVEFFELLVYAPDD